jgi:hypothetical protein
MLFGLRAVVGCTAALGVGTADRGLRSRVIYGRCGSISCPASNSPPNGIVDLTHPELISQFSYGAQLLLLLFSFRLQS